MVTNFLLALGSLFLIQQPGLSLCSLLLGPSVAFLPCDSSTRPQAALCCSCCRAAPNLGWTARQDKACGRLTPGGATQRDLGQVGGAQPLRQQKLAVRVQAVRGRRGSQLQSHAHTQDVAS